MGDVFDDLPGRPPLQRIWQGQIATNPVDFSERVSVIIPGLVPSTRWEGCRWQSRNSVDMPQRGDDCLIMIDNNNELWVVVWWPFL